MSGKIIPVAAPAGLEPANEGVKVPCLTTWLRRYVAADCPLRRRGWDNTRKVGKKGRYRRLWQPTWSERWDLNPRLLDPKSSALPLRYAQIKRTAIQQSSNFGKDRDIGFELGNQFFILHIEWHLLMLLQPVKIIQ